MKLRRSCGILGGTFDPIHIGHLHAAEQIRQTLNLDIIYFVPNRSPVHKPEGAIASAEDRFQMVSLAVQSNPHFVTSRVELDRLGPSYAIDTIEEFAQSIEPNTQIHFVVGTDSLPTLSLWHRYSDLLDCGVLVAVTRPGATDTTAFKYGDRGVRYVEISPVDISSTSVRDEIKNGRSARYLAPDCVLDYIKSKNLYR